MRNATVSASVGERRRASASVSERQRASAFSRVPMIERRRPARARIYGSETCKNVRARAFSAAHIDALEMLDRASVQALICIALSRGRKREQLNVARHFTFLYRCRCHRV